MRFLDKFYIIQEIYKMIEKKLLIILPFLGSLSFETGID